MRKMPPCLLKGEAFSGKVKKSYPQMHGAKSGGDCVKKLLQKVCIFFVEMV